MGWERANWFATAGHGAGATATATAARTGFPAPPTSIARCARAVGLFDQSSFAKLRFEGPDAVAVLQRLCANDVDVPPGRIVYTQMLNRAAASSAT